MPLVKREGRCYMALASKEIAIPDRLALLGSFAIHVLLAVTFFFQSTHFSMQPAGSGNGQAISVELYRGPANASEVSETVEPVSESLPLAGSQSGETENFFPPPSNLDSNSRIVLPPQEAPYFPSGSVDSKPYPRVPVVIPFPDGAPPQQRITAILILYIGTDGQVDRVEIEQSELPPAFEKAALDAFRQASMQPAMKEGRPVRAKMKIQVEFEAP